MKRTTLQLSGAAVLGMAVWIGLVIYKQADHDPARDGDANAAQRQANRNASRPDMRSGLNSASSATRHPKLQASETERVVYNPGYSHRYRPMVEHAAPTLLTSDEATELSLQSSLAQAGIGPASVKPLLGILARPDLRGLPQANVVHQLTLTIENPEDYATLTKRFAGQQLDEHAMDVVFADLLQREDEVKIPILAELAETDGHRFQKGSRAILAVYADMGIESNRDILDQWSKEQAAKP